jgi:hypothetical protein
LRAAKATKTVEGAAKVPKKTLAGHIQQILDVKNDFIMLNKIFCSQNWAFHTNLSGKFKK